MPALSALFAAAALIAASAQNPFVLNLGANGGYTLAVAAFKAFNLTSGDTAVQVGGHVYSTGTGDLELSATTQGNGSDAWGPYTSTAQTWSVLGVETLITASRCTSELVPAVIFRQEFPAGINATGGGNKDGVISAFPSLQLPSQPGLGFMQYLGAFIDNGVSGPNLGQFQVGAHLESGLQAGSGPLALFDTAGNTVVISAASSFMSASSAVLNTAAGKSSLAFGLMGSATSVPAWHSVETMAWYGVQGVNTGMQAWGAALLLKYGKAHGLSTVDFTNTYLGYNTDHGAYYYYQPAPYADFSQVLSAVYNYSVQAGIPYKHVLLGEAVARDFYSPLCADLHSLLPISRRFVVVFQGRRRRREELDGHALYLRGRQFRYSRHGGADWLEDYRAQQVLVRQHGLRQAEWRQVGVLHRRQGRPDGCAHGAGLLGLPAAVLRH